MSEIRFGSRGSGEKGRRSYTPEYKRDVLQECEEPSVSVAAGVALARGTNTNLANLLRP